MPHVTTLRVGTRLITVMLLALAPQLSAQSPPASFGYAMLVAGDTVGIERVTIQDGRWTGTVAVRNQGRVIWTAAVGPQGRYSELHLAAFRTAADTAPSQVVTLSLAGDSVHFAMTVPAQQVRMLPSKADAFMLLNTSVAMVELLVARVSPGASATIPVFLSVGGQTIDATVQRDRDSARVTLAGQVTVVQLEADGTVKEGVSTAQNLRFVRLTGPALARAALGAPNYDPPPGAPYGAEHVRIPVPGGHELAATFTRPTGVGTRLPAVVTISGSGAQDRDELIPIASGYRPFRQIADTLGRRGIAVLRFDDRGYGGSTGDASTATSADFADDVRAAVAWLRARPDVDPDKVFLLGHSEGGMIAPMVAASDTALAGIVLLAGPSQNGRDIIHYQQRYAIDRDTSLKTDVSRDSAARIAHATFDSLAQARPWFAYFVAHDPIAVARRVRTPALILHGETDRQVTQEQATELGAALRASGNADVTVRVYPGLNHLFLQDPDGNPANYLRAADARIGSGVLGVIADWVAARTRAQSSRPAWATSLDSLVRSELQRTRTPGAAVAVVVDGRVAYAAGYGIANIETGQPVTTDMLFRVGSVTKMFTAATLTQLAHEGKLSLTAPISAVVPELRGKRVGQVTPHQLLTHTSGWLDNAVAYGRMGEGALGEVMREVTDTMFFTEPSRVISYSNPGYSMAGYVAEVAGGARFATLVEDNVMRPTGMTRATFRPLQALTLPSSMGHIAPPNQSPAVVRPFTENTAQWGAGFLFASAPEIARFSMMLMDYGSIDGKSVLAPETVRRMTTSTTVIPGRPAEDSARYAYGITTSKRGGELVWQHGGSINGFDATVVMLPGRKFAVVLLDNLSGAPLNGIVDAAIKYVTGLTPPTQTPPPPRDATPAERGALVGRYAMGRTSVEIADESGALVFKQGAQTRPLRLAGSNGLVIGGANGPAIRMAFVRGADGRVAYLHQATRALARQ
jgi:CubicO group peptidase (beta-lactamase class C family)/alpha-beta hydrolase superfamily lysophospholipase